MTKRATKLKAPFPYFGGKSRVAQLVWDRLGDVDNFIEPFCGSAAVLLARPHPPRIETVNDADCYVANFWRSTSCDPEAVAEFADGPVNEADLHARHRWLVLSDEAKAFRERMRREPDYMDAKVAGWWCWGLCCWIGGGWCTPHGEAGPDGADRKECIPTPLHKGVANRGKKGPAGGTGTRSVILGGGDGQLGHGVHAKGQPQRRPRAHGGYGSLPGVHGEEPHGGAANSEGFKRIKIPDGGEGTGVHGKMGEQPCEWNQMPILEPRGVNPATIADGRPQLADAFSRGRGVNGNDSAGTCTQRRAWLVDWFSRLRDRLRTVRVCCGNWLRVCDSESVTTRLGLTGVFFDPPYSTEAGRDMNLYGVDSGTVAHDVRAYCLERGKDKANADRSGRLRGRGA